MTLVGPFWTRTQVARLLGVSSGAVVADGRLLRIDGALSVEEAYPSFQFDGGVVRREVEFLARLLKRRVTDVEACDWLRRPRRSIDGRTPVDWLALDGDVDRVMRILPEPSRPVPGAAAEDAEAERIVWTPGGGRRSWSPSPATR